MSSKRTRLRPVTCHRPGNARLDLQDAATVPGLIGRQLIGNRGTRPDQRHVSAKHVQELGQLIEAGFAQELPDRRNSLVAGQLVDALAVGGRRNAFRHTGDQLLHIFLWTDSSLLTRIERNFRKVKRRPYCPIRSCRKRIGPLEVSFDREGDDREQRHAYGSASECCPQYPSPA